MNITSPPSPASSTRTPGRLIDESYAAWRSAAESLLQPLSLLMKPGKADPDLSSKTGQP